MAQPDLYALSGQGDRLVLLAGLCGDCQVLSFPMQALGCTACGSRALAERRLDGTAKLLNFVTLHVDLSSDLPAGSVICECEIAPGVVVEALLDGAERDFTVGERVQAVARNAPGDPEKIVCRFSKAEGQE